MSLRRDDYLNDPRFRGATTLKEFDNPYDIDTAELQDLFARGVKPFFVQEISLGVQSGGTSAPAWGAWQEINVPGNHVVIFGFDSTSSIDVINTTVFMEVVFGPNRPSDAQDELGFPLKHNRGLSGPFTKCFVRWPAQTAAPNTSCKLIIFRYKYRPWISGESAT